MTGSSVYAQTTLTAEIRPRAELRHGFRRMPLPDEKPAGFVSQRSRLALGYQQENVRLHFSIQDVRAWGQAMQRSHNPSLDIHEAWAELLFSETFSLKAGRQELRYDNQRFFAINNWNQAGQKHDMVLLKYHSGERELHFGSAFNQQDPNRLFGTDYTIDNYKYLNFAWFRTPLWDHARLSLLGVADGFQPIEQTQSLYVRGTWSAFFTYQPGSVRLILNPAFQHGKNPQGQETRAYYYRAEMVANFIEGLRSSLGAEVFSGNDFTDPQDQKSMAFDALYGVGYRYNGYMNYFIRFPADTRGAGLINPFLYNKFSLTPNTTLDTDIHLFFLENNYVHQGQVISKYLGTELDITLTYRFNDFTQISGGFSMMFGTESMEVIRGGSKDEAAYWTYLMIQVKPRIF